MTPDQQLAELIKTAEYHVRLATNKSNFWYPVDQWFRFAIPVLSAVLTAVASDKTPLPKDSIGSILFWMGGALTVFTVMNATLQPSQKYSFNSSWSNKFTRLKTKLEIGYEQAALGQAAPEEREKAQLEKAQLDFLDQQNAELEH